MKARPHIVSANIILLFCHTSQTNKYVFFLSRMVTTTSILCNHQDIPSIPLEFNTRKVGKLNCGEANRVWSGGRHRNQKRIRDRIC